MKWFKESAEMPASKRQDQKKIKYFEFIMAKKSNKSQGELKNHQLLLLFKI